MACFLLTHILGSCPVTELCQVQNSLCVQLLRSPILAALTHGTRGVGVSESLRRRTRNGITELSQRAPPIFGRAAITLGISPHSSLLSRYSGTLFSGSSFVAVFVVSVQPCSWWCAGPFKVVYMSANYSHGLTYQCSSVSPRDGHCGRATIAVIARSRDLSPIALADVMQHVTKVCIRPSELRIVSHDGSCVKIFISPESLIR